MEDIIPSITCTSLFQFCNTITYPSAGLIHKPLSRHDKIGTFIKRILAHPTGLWYFFHNGVQCLKPDTVRALPRTRSPKLICNFTPDFYWVKWSSRYSVPSLVWSNLSSINTAFLYFFFAISDYELNRNTMECLLFFRKIGRIQPNPKGRCPLQGSLPILLNVQIGVSLFKHCRRCCQSNLSAPWRKSRWKNIKAAYLLCQQIFCKIH